MGKAERKMSVKPKGIRRFFGIEREGRQSAQRAPEKQRRWWSVEAQRWYIILGFSVIVSVLLYPDLTPAPQAYRPGDVADRDIKAVQDFLVENEELTEKSRQDAVKSLLPVYDFDPTGGNVLDRLKVAFEAGRAGLSTSTKAASPELHKGEVPPEKEVAEHPGASNEEDPAGFFEKLGISPDRGLYALLEETGFDAGIEKAVTELLGGLFQQGVVGNEELLINHAANGIILHDITKESDVMVSDVDRFLDMNAAVSWISSSEHKEVSFLDGKSLRAVSEVAKALLRPNLTFNKRETQIRKDNAYQSVKPFYFKVKKGEMLVREGERITSEHLAKLETQENLLKSDALCGRAPAMAAFIGFLMMTLYFTGLMNPRSTRIHSRDLLFNSLTCLGVFFVVIAGNLVADEISRGFGFFTARALLFAFPVAGGAMLVSIFHGMRVSAVFSLVMSTLASLAVGGQVDFFLFYFITSLVAGHGVVNCKERGVLTRASLKTGAVGLALSLAVQTLHGYFYSLETIVAGVSAVIGGLLAGVIATGLLPLVEMTFGYTTDIKLLELANLDQPLLKEQMVQAPGTYHHSVIVSNMVEASAKSIGANPLLAKVAAYYHDIGKIKKPLYFIENQIHCENKHEKLAPSMSSLILISHVKDGVEMARKQKLGKEIIDIIQQHHGTSIISYFYEKAKEQAGKRAVKSPLVKEQDFRYPGPKPQTKEAGLVMLADMVEAASRSLVDPTPAKIQGMLQKIIKKVFSDGQLDECELTLKDLNEIAKSFSKTLSGIFHHRVDYPEPSGRPASARKGANGNSDYHPQADARFKKEGDKGEAGESLKRLGL
ncbi:MAG TPA: HDIG domain-containing protein [Desulfobacteraceae bacterium]|nr:HDIG domain-containing protein [Desulfobacteraceae bacterium]